MIYFFSTAIWAIVTLVCLYAWANPNPRGFMPEIGVGIAYLLAFASTFFYLVFLMCVFIYRSKWNAVGMVALVMILLALIFYNVHIPSPGLQRLRIEG